MAQTEAQSSSSFGIESFYKFVGEGRLMAAKCNKCGLTMLPPRPVCTNCYSKDLKWTELKGKGTLLTYTVIHVAPKQFEMLVPYAVGIVELDKGSRLLGMIRGVEPDKIKVGMSLTIEFDKKAGRQAQTQAQWPTWSRYYFKPA